MAAAPEIDNSEGAEFGGGGGTVAYASSLGFVGAYTGSSFSLVVSPVATRDGAMQRDYWYTAHRKLAALEPPADIGREAARRALRRLGGRRVPTTTCPVVFDPQMAASLLRHPGRRALGPRALPTLVVPARQARRDDRRAGPHHHRRPAASRRSRVAPLRRRGRGVDPTHARRAGRAQELPARLVFRPPPRPAHHGPTRAAPPATSPAYPRRTSTARPARTAPSRSWRRSALVSTSPSCSASA